MSEKLKNKEEVQETRVEIINKYLGIRTLENGTSQVVSGKFIIKEYKNEQEAKKAIKQKDWEIIIAMIAIGLNSKETK